MQVAAERIEPLGKEYQISYPPVSGKGSVRTRRYSLQTSAADLLPGERVSWCMRRLRQGSETVDVIYHAEHEHASYGNLMTCGSVWVCPICAARITERRRSELEVALKSGVHKSVFMVTLTLQHEHGTPLKELLDALNDAARRMKAGSPWGRFVKKWGILGFVSGLEVTHGFHGWHPHRHILFFSSLSEEELNEDEIQAQLYTRYSRILAKRGVYAHPIHGVDVRIGNAYAGNYLAKWGAAEEISKSNTKKAKEGGTSPWQLLELAGEGKAYAGKLFVEYAAALKGCRYLSYSHGFRELFQLGEEKTDEEIAAEKEKGGEVILTLTWAEWKRVLLNDVRGELLNVACTGDVARLGGFLAYYGIRKPEGVT